MTSPAPSRFGTFFSRVETERTVLSIINQPGKASHELHGLTATAIDRWAVAMNGVDGHKAAHVAEVSRLLHRISIRVDAHADQSRVVFADEAQTNLPVDELIRELRAAQRQLNSPF